MTSEPSKVIWRYLSDRTGIPWSTDFVGIARVRETDILGAVGYNGFTKTSCWMHMAGDHPRWVTREFLMEAFRYPFEQLGLTMVLGTVSSGNIRALNMDFKLGFKELIYIPGAHEDGGLHILQMLREDCRWLRKPHGQEVNSHAA